MEQLTVVNELFLRHIPSGLGPILHVGCGNGQFGASVRQRDSGRAAFGVERAGKLANIATDRLDRVFLIDIETEAPPLQTGSLDCIVYGDTLSQLRDPEAVLRRDKSLLRSGGEVLISIRNVQHHSFLTNLLAGEFPYRDAG